MMNTKEEVIARIDELLKQNLPSGIAVQTPKKNSYQFHITWGEYKKRLRQQVLSEGSEIFHLDKAVYRVLKTVQALTYFRKRVKQLPKRMFK